MRLETYVKPKHNITYINKIIYIPKIKIKICKSAKNFQRCLFLLFYMTL